MNRGTATLKYRTEHTQYIEAELYSYIKATEDLQDGYSVTIVEDTKQGIIDLLSGWIEETESAIVWVNNDTQEIIEYGYPTEVDLIAMAVVEYKPRRLKTDLEDLKRVKDRLLDREDVIYEKYKVYVCIHSDGSITIFEKSNTENRLERIVEGITIKYDPQIEQIDAIIEDLTDETNNNTNTTNNT